MKKEKIEAYIRSSVEENIVPGISYAYIRPNLVDIQYVGKIGAVPPFQTQDVSEGLLYDLASLTKVLGTTTRILQLIDEKKLEFFTKIGDILDQVKEKEVTIRQLLLHRAGYPADISNKYDLNKEELSSAVLHASLELTPDTSMQYSDIGFILLGKVIEKIDYCTLEESFQKNIWQPLKMEHTSYSPKVEKRFFVPTEVDSQRGQIQGEIHDYKGYILGQSGSAGLFSTLSDLILFVKAYLHKDNALFSNEMFLEIEKTCIDKRTYGWDKRYGNTTIYHTGFTGTSILMNLQTCEGFIILTNRVHPSRDKQEYFNVREKLNEIFMNMEEIK